MHPDERRPFSIIILSKTWSNLQPCVHALHRCGEDGRIIVVDDFWYQPSTDFGGPDGHTLRGPHYNGQRIDWIKGEKPFNFSRNTNLAIEHAGRDDVFLLNDDALLQTPRGITNLAAEYWAKIRVFLNARGRPPQFGAISALISGMAAAPDQVLQSVQLERGIRPVRHHMMAFMATYIPRYVIDAVGELDPRFVGYGYEDDDYCRRLRDAGFALGVFDGCIVDHNITLPSTFRGGKVPGGPDLLAQNRAIFEDKWQSANA